MARLPAGRWLAVGAVALAEYLFLAILVDSAALAARIGVARYASSVVAVGVTGVAALVGLGGRRVRERWDELVTGSATLRSVLPRVAAHAACYAAFAWLTLRLFDDPPRLSGDLRLWFALWVAGALATAALLAAVAVPPRSLLALLWNARKGVAAAIAVSLLAFVGGRAALDLWQPLASLTLHGAEVVLRLFTARVVAEVETRTIGTDRFAVQIADVCSGIEGLGLILAYLAGWLAWARAELRWPRALLLLPLGAAAALAVNVLRIAALVGVGDQVSEQLAIGSFHSRAGWILFCAAALGVTWLGRRLRFFRARPAADGEPWWNPTAAYLGPMLAAVAAALLTGLLSSGFDLLYPLRTAAALAVLFLYRRELPRPRWSPGWEAPALGAAGFAVWMVLEPAPDPALAAGFSAALGELPAWGRAAWLTLRAAGAVLVVPLVEELAFRGFLLRRLVAPDFPEVQPGQIDLPALLVSSLAFGAIHQRWVAGTLTGLLFAVAWLRRGRLSDAVVAHATANALIAAWVLTGNRFWLW